MVFRTLKRMIEKGNLEGIEDKIDIFYAASKITREEYEILIEMIRNLEENTENAENIEDADGI